MGTYYGLKSKDGLNYEFEVFQDKKGIHIRSITPIRPEFPPDRIEEKKKVPKLRTRADFAHFLTEYYRNGNIINFLNQYDFKDEK
jgi:hypothetical protein